MPTTSKQQHERLTVSLPHGYSREIKRLATELNLSQSDIVAKAFDAYRESQQRKKVEEIARSMVDEYKQNSDLVALMVLDGEDFK